jgi:hypothetical protein
MLLKVYKNNKCFNFIIDAEDYEKIKDWKMSPVENGCGQTYLRLTKHFDYYSIYTYFHRYIMNCPTDMVVDHINNNTFDNRKQNLRITTEVQNRWNSKACNYKNKKKSSQFIGVIWSKQKNRWRAQVDNTYLGLFENEKDAAYAYDTYCRKYRGEYAKLNFPNEIVEIDVVKRRNKCN